jgi:phage gp36-like protein
MANQLNVSLQALATVTASQTGEAVDIGTRTAGLLSVEVDAIAVDGHVVLLETSPDSITWRIVAQQPYSAPQNQVRAVEGLQRYVRARVAMAAGGGASLLLSVDLEAHQIYCDQQSIRRYGLPAGALESVTDEEMLEVCLAATDECDSYLGAAFTLPLLQWGRDLRIHAAKMATMYLLDRRGWDPQGADAPIKMGHERAVRWLEQVAKGGLSPAGLIDSTTDVVDSGSVVFSRPKREPFTF